MAIKETAFILCLILLPLMIEAEDKTVYSAKEYDDGTIEEERETCIKDCGCDPWQKLNTDPICFGARRDSYGSFSIPRTGRVKAMKLVHKSGSIYCNRVFNDSYWGCVNNQAYTINDLLTIITDTNRDAVLPPAEDLQSFPRHICGRKHYYTLEGAERNSPELMFRNAVDVTEGQELQIWYGQDFADCGESDNSGATCVDVYAWYIQTSV